jgi:nucleoside 2-deoxyribosyltransferase
MKKVYIAGPEVFFTDGADIIRRKGELARKYGFEANSFEAGDFPSEKFAFGMAISKANEDVMRGSDFVLANMTPFRGVSTDVGTAYEIGFMCALGKDAFAYTNDPRFYDVRISDDYYAGKVGPGADGMIRGHSDGWMVEDHTMVDNLMLDGGIIARGGLVARAPDGVTLPWSDLSVFELGLKAARAFYDRAS